MACIMCLDEIHIAGAQCYKRDKTLIRSSRLAAIFHLDAVATRRKMISDSTPVFGPGSYQTMSSRSCNETEGHMEQMALIKPVQIPLP